MAMFHSYVKLPEGTSTTVSTAEDRLVKVRSVVGSFKAFCALLSDGTVVAWGDAKSGGVVPPSVEGRW